MIGIGLEKFLLLNPDEFESLDNKSTIYKCV